jgi:ATP-dependent RNA helicase RhlB
MSQQHLSDTSFRDLALHEDLLQALDDIDFKLCTPIQAQSLPVALGGRNVAGKAQTGTGKTMAFLLACMNQLLNTERKGPQPRTLILAPTRELVIQIHKDACSLNKQASLKLGLVYGGTGYQEQKEQVQQGIDILIGTPGRLIDYFKQGVFDLKSIQSVVLDEADRMFDLGFIKDVRFLLRRMPKPEKRLNMLFSATFSFKVQELAYEHMGDPEMVETEADKVTAENISQCVYYTAMEEKIPLLINLLKETQEKRSIVFVNTKRTSEKIFSYLSGNDIKSALLSGDVPQKMRQKLLEKFKAGELNVLVATDVAARGLHVDDVGYVFNFDLPDNAEDYVHRIGRTARAGAEGHAVSFVCEKYAFSLPDIEKYIHHKLPIEGVTDELVSNIKPPVKTVFKKVTPFDKKNNSKSHKSHNKPHKKRHPSGNRPPKKQDS